jgi:hypothetical protein
MRRLAALGAIVLVVATCGFVPRPPIVCDQLPSDTCRAVAAAVLADIRAGHPVSLVVVNGYRGYCLPLPIYCPLLPVPVTSPPGALVAVKFSDGAESVLRLVADVSARRLEIEDFDSSFANALIDTHQGAPRE